MLEALALALSSLRPVSIRPSAFQIGEHPRPALISFRGPLLLYLRSPFGSRHWLWLCAGLSVRLLAMAMVAAARQASQKARILALVAALMRFPALDCLEPPFDVAAVT